MVKDGRIQSCTCRQVGLKRSNRNSRGMKCMTWAARNLFEMGYEPKHVEREPKTIVDK